MYLQITWPRSHTTALNNIIIIMIILTIHTREGCGDLDKIIACLWEERPSDQARLQARDTGDVNSWCIYVRLWLWYILTWALYVTVAKIKPELINTIWTCDHLCEYWTDVFFGTPLNKSPLTPIFDVEYFSFAVWIKLNCFCFSDCQKPCTKIVLYLSAKMKGHPPTLSGKEIWCCLSS